LSVERKRELEREKGKGDETWRERREKMERVFLGKNPSAFE
jgi:hypothetical protein